MGQQNDHTVTPEAVAELREHASSLQRELDRRHGVEGELIGRLEAQRREASESAAVLRLLIDSVQDYAIFMLDPTGRVMTWNVGAQRCKGYAADEIIGRHFSTFYRAPDVAAGKCEYELEVAARAGRFEEEDWRVRKDGSEFWANVVITPMHGGDGTLVGFAKVTRDLTERRSAVEQRRRDEERFRLLIESVRDYAIFILDPSGIVATWNPGAARIKGYEPDEIIGRHFSVFYPEADVLAGKCDMELDIAAREGRFEDEGWRVRKDGSRLWANVVITALRDETGALTGFGKVTRDLTERKAAEERRRVEDQRFALLVSSVKDYALFILDPAGNVATWNTGAERIKGYTAQEIVGSHFSRFYPEDDVRAGKCEHELATAAREGSFEDEGWRIRKDGSRFWANVVISAIHDELGNLVGYSKVTRDLTERKRSEDEIAARKAAEHANRTKDEFLAMLGHELRNPLAPIVSAIQLLKLRDDKKSAREHQVIERQVRQMVHLVDDLLDVSRISRGKIELKKAPMDLRDALAKASEIAIPLFERKRQDFEVRVPPFPLVVDGDDARLTQVFANLLNNAAKYTGEGGRITLTVRHNRTHIVAEVQDNGIGIEPGLLSRVFELFVQGYQDADRAEGGLGIGLTLVRSLVHLHGGEVEARSGGVDAGSTFLVRLPAVDQILEVETTPEPSVILSAAPGKRRQVLLVDDNEDARMLLADLLARFGHSVKAAADGPSALAVLEVFKPDVAILDIGLPGMDGYELAMRIREMPDHKQLRLFALTGYGQPRDVTHAKDAGFEVHLVKPIDVDRLLFHIVSS
jgi:PAS domain S-box-containing protein